MPAQATLDLDANAKLDLLLAKIESLEARMDADREAADDARAPLDLALAGMTDDMVKNLVGRLSQLAEVVLDPGVTELLTRFQDPRVQRSLGHLTDPATLDDLEGTVDLLSLLQSGMTDDMVKNLVGRASQLAELILDPFIMDALQTMARALKAGQAEYPTEKVPPVGGVFGALRAANDPDTRRVMAFALAVTRNLGKEFS